jgi:hypothetical protein
MIRTLVLAGLLITTTVGSAWGQARQLIPTSYEAGRFFAAPEIAGGNTVRLLVDTAGPSIFGLYGISDKAARRLNLPAAPCNVSGATITTVKPFHSNPELPVAKGTPCNSVAFVDSRFDAMNSDGCLGDKYLMHFIWTFDYPKKQLWHEPDSWKPSATMHGTSMGFLKNEKGENLGGVPRITIWVGDESIDMVLKTGAPAFHNKSPPDVQPAYSGSSFLAKSSIDQLLHDRPDCCSVVIDDHQNRMIEIQKIKIAGWLVGPVWFAELPDAFFSRYSSDGGREVDMPVHGVAGPSIFDHFSMTLDYQTEKAWLACASGCSVANN